MLVGLGIKPVSKPGTVRLIRAALEYAVRQKRKSVTFVHKGNIMKYTEGAFQTWGYEVAAELPGGVISEAEFSTVYKGQLPAGKTVLKDAVLANLLRMSCEEVNDSSLRADAIDGEYTDVLTKEVDRVNRIIESLLDLGRPWNVINPIIGNSFGMGSVLFLVAWHVALYLTVQLLELGIPVIVALNIYDEAEKKGYRIDIRAMEQALGVSVVPTVATRKTSSPAE